MSSLIRNFTVLSAAALLAACGGGDAATTATPGTDGTATAQRTAFESPDDHAMGSPDAPVTLVEYASVSCAACGVWHRNVFPEIKQKYVDTGKVRFVFREFLASDPNMADAGFMIALCAPEEDYFKNIKAQFDRQPQIFKLAQQGQMRQAYVNVAKAAGLDTDEFVECMKNKELRDGYMARMEKGIDAGVTGTPAFFINGTKAKGSLEELQAALDAAIAEAAE